MRDARRAAARGRTNGPRRDRRAAPRRGGGRLWLPLLAGIATAAIGPVAGAEDDAARPGLFVLGPQDVGISLGYGHGTSITTSGRIEGKNVDELVVVGHWQIELTRRPIEPAWYKGVLALRIEPLLLVNFSPRTGVAGGAGAIFRYQLTRWERTRPFVEAGAGLIGLDFDVVDQADGLAFTPTASLGVQHRLNERLSLEVVCRFQHISNAYTQRPNGGIDAFQYLLGATWHL
jgi:hypothetical protein